MKGRIFSAAHFAAVAAATVSLILPLALAAPVAAETVRVTYRFDSPAIEAARDGFVRIAFAKTIQAGRPGEPSYPFRGASILLPPGEALSSITVAKRGWTILEGAHTIFPMQETVPGVETEKGAGRFLMKSAAYAVDSWVAPPASAFSTHYLRGRAIAVGTICPVAYRPAAGEVGYYREIEIAVETAPSAKAAAALGLLRTDAATAARIARVVDNAGGLAAYDALRPARAASTDEYELLIIAPDSMAAAWAPLRDFYTRRGMRATVMTRTSAETMYIGADAAEKIREAIKHEYQQHGVTHVLLAGDGDGAVGTAMVMPYRGLYCQVQSSSTYTDEAIPADCYFANLDGTWNADSDARWGEPGEEDFFAEVAVGRACVDDLAEIATFINKTTKYQDQPVAAQLRRALMLGEYLYGDPLTYGDDEIEQLIGTCTAYGFITTGYPTDWSFTKHYDRNGTWPKSAVWTAVNAGTNWVNHAGHTNSGYAMRLYRSDVTDANFTNDGASANFPLVYSYGCYAGSFDNKSTSGYESADCIAEVMCTIQHFAAAFIGNSRYGWFTEGTTNGPSHHYQREFFDALFTEGVTTLGEANVRSKDETVPFIDLPEEYEPGAHRWCFYVLNVLGDPALDSWTDTPAALSPSHDPSLARGDTLFAFYAVPGAVACLYRDGLCYGRGIADGYGYIALSVYRAIPPEVSSLELDVRAHDRYVYRDTIEVLDPAGGGAPPAGVSLAQNRPNPFNPSTEIRFSLPRAGLVDIRAYDAAGREVALIFSGPKQAGEHSVEWRAVGLASGIYFYALRANGVVLTRKAVLLR